MQKENEFWTRIVALEAEVESLWRVIGVIVKWLNLKVEVKDGTERAAESDSGTRE